VTPSVRAHVIFTVDQKPTQEVVRHDRENPAPQIVDGPQKRITVPSHDIESLFTLSATRQRATLLVLNITAVRRSSDHVHRRISLSTDLSNPAGPVRRCSITRSGLYARSPDDCGGSVTSTEQSRLKYDALADRYEEIFFYVADLGRRLVEVAAPRPGARVLDVGAGRGAVARAALVRGCVVTAVDSSGGMVAKLRSDHPTITARQLDAGRLDFPDGSFDVVTAGFLVQVLDDPAAALAEFHRVLAPGGTVALSLERHTVGRLGWLHELNAKFFGSAGEAADPLSADRLDALLTEAGFGALTRTDVDIPKPMAGPQALWNWLALQGVPQALEALPSERAAEFRRAFFAGAEEMHADGGIVLEFGATLHRGTLRARSGRRFE
jgi:SAM-dependent methyltransferase